MKTTFHKIMLVLVVFTLLLTMTACGGGDGDTDTDTHSCSDATCLIARGIDKFTGDGDGELELTEIFATPTP